MVLKIFDCALCIIPVLDLLEHPHKLDLIYKTFLLEVSRKVIIYIEYVSLLEHPVVQNKRWEEQGKVMKRLPLYRH
jgi:hypothetical protein